MGGKDDIYLPEDFVMDLGILYGAPELKTPLFNQFKKICNDYAVDLNNEIFESLYQKSLKDDGTLKECMIKNCKTFIWEEINS